MHPYQNINPYQHWKTAVTDIAPPELDPVVSFKFKIANDDKVATAGSCFAQHIARYLSNSGFNYYVAEQGHPFLTKQLATKYNYSVFSARYGNIYTSRQLVQLHDRAFGQFTPIDNAWLNADGRWFDPYRPNIQPNGFESREELELDRAEHFKAVREMFSQLDVFVFTLGLTEVWVSARDGAAYPVCPGVAAGEFKESEHIFRNLTVDEVIADLEMFLEKLGAINQKAKVILTVSPVPLMATAEDRHVVQSTCLSKAVLRVAADAIDRKHDHVCYFPSYEIITSNSSRGGYYGEDLRSVKEQGVKHVMSMFLRHATVSSGPMDSAKHQPGKKQEKSFDEKMEEIVELICDENSYVYE